MAIKKSTYTGGSGRPMLHSPNVANVPAEAIIEHTFKEAVAATDILELAYLPAYCKLLSVELLSVGTAAVTFDVGFMSGRVGSPDPARTCGSEILNDVTPTTKADATLTALAGLAATDQDRSIGIVPSATVAASGTTKITMRVRYAKGNQ
jgi:hypothetical protein